MTVKKATKGLKFYGQGEELFGIHIVNLFLTLVTLGIYSFWARVKVRKYLWGQMAFDKDRLSYHGTGEETIRGWFKAAIIFGIPYLLVTHGPRWMGASTGMILLGAFLSLPLILIFFPMAVVGSRRYRLSRTAWRGIRFSFRQTWQEYLPMSWKGNILIALTLGLYTPYYEMTREKFLISNTYVGNKHFDFDGDPKELFGNYVAALLLALPTLGVSLFWYHVVRLRYVWNHTTFGKARFHCTITFEGLMKIVLGNLLLVLFTLGFAYPWAQVRSIHYMVRNLSLQGKTDLRRIKQKAQTVNATGEELASFFDLDFDLG